MTSQARPGSVPVAGPQDDPQAGSVPGPTVCAAARVEVYVGRLASSLPPRLAESNTLLAEVRDHLLCEVEQASASGLPVGAALDAAMAQVGDPLTVGSGWRREIVRGAVRAADTALLRLVVLAGAGWLLVLSTGPAAHWRGPEPRSIPRLEELGSAGAGVSVAAATAGVLLAGLAGARARAGVRAAAVGWLDRWALTATALALVAAVLAAADLADLLTTRSSAAPGSVTGHGVLIGTAVSLAASAVTVPGLHRLGRVVLPVGGRAPGRRQHASP